MSVVPAVSASASAKSLGKPLVTTVVDEVGWPTTYPRTVADEPSWVAARRRDGDRGGGGVRGEGGGGRKRDGRREHRQRDEEEQGQHLRRVTATQPETA